MRDERGRCTTLGCTSPCAKTKLLFKGNGEFWNLNLLRYFHKTHPQVLQRRKKTFPMGTHVHEQGHGAERTGAERTGPEHNWTLGRLPTGDTTPHAHTHSFARSHARTKRNDFPAGLPHNLRYIMYLILYYIILYYIISYHIISYHIIPYHIISYHDITWISEMTFSKSSGDRFLTPNHYRLTSW